MLEGVEHQEQSLFSYKVAEGFVRRLSPRFPQPQRAGDGGNDQLCVVQRSQGDTGHAIREEIRGIARCFQCQTRLSDAAHAGKGEHPNLRTTQEIRYLP
jgi:hypothetical protein